MSKFHQSVTKTTSKQPKIMCNFSILVLHHFKEIDLERILVDFHHFFATFVAVRWIEKVIDQSVKKSRFFAPKGSVLNLIRYWSFFSMLLLEKLGKNTKGYWGLNLMFLSDLSWSLQNASIWKGLTARLHFLSNLTRQKLSSWRPTFCAHNSYSAFCSNHVNETCLFLGIQIFFAKSVKKLSKHDVLK